ncbi:amidohydrolase family protein [Vibrio sp. S4M6]|uniref:amidohydrolase family protein n=1 Tax=Vibrio sinus TaxID=2946865 RepID=UPI00202A8E0C|nr:amidohydrolase family protein [Vibrio sinus]MCL9783439.1 amidohydrolase family protein [Vibrio sinus]
MHKFIDTHLHLFDIESGDYHWLKPGNPPFWSDKAKLYRNYHEKDLQLGNNDELAGYVHIEAGYDNTRSWREVEWLEKHCQLPFRSVAAVDLTIPPKTFQRDLEKLTGLPSVVGVRHIFDEQALALLCNENVTMNLRQLAKFGLSFELQMYMTDSAAIEELNAQLPSLAGLKILINHAGFPPSTTSPEWDTWCENLSLLARYSECAIKCSGWEMSRRDYDINWVASVIDFCVESFGEDRVMLGSNFPLCLLSKPYQQLWTEYQSRLAEKNKALFYDNALKWYRF